MQIGQILFYIILSLTSLSAVAEEKNYAIIEARPLAHNSKIVTYTYKEDHIYKYIGTYEFQTHIRFAPDETVKTISMGNSSAWEIVQSGNRMFLRPLSKNAETNMTLITNKRLYQFMLDAVHAESFDDPHAIFEARFQYDSDKEGFTIINDKKSDELDLSEPGKYNFNYTFTGPDTIAPVKVFDDGDFTYFEFRQKNAELPAIFTVDSQGYEGLVNYRVKGNYIIVERITDLYTLRHGVDTVCVFNEELRYQRQPKDKKKK